MKNIASLKYAGAFLIVTIFLTTLKFNVAAAHDIKEKSAHYSSTCGRWEAVTYGDKVAVKFTNQNDGSAQYSIALFSKEVFNFKKIRSDAGVINLKTKPGNKFKNGTFTFVENNSFHDFLLEKDIQNAGILNMMSMALFNVNKSFINELYKGGLVSISAEQLVGFRLLNINRNFLSLLRNNGYSGLTAAQILAAKSMVINKDFFPVESALPADVTKKNPFDLLIIKRAADIANGHLGNVSKDSVDFDAVMSFSKKNSSIKTELIPMANVSLTFLNGLKEFGYKKISKNEFYGLAINNFDSEYLVFLNKYGYSKTPLYSLIAFRIIGIDEPYIQELTNVGYNNLHYTELLDFKTFNIDEKYISEIKKFSNDSISSDWLITYKMSNITPNFIDGFYHIGYKNLTIDQVIMLKYKNIKPEDITLLKKNGIVFEDINSYINLKTQEKVN